MTKRVEKTYQFENPEQEMGLVGPADAHLRLLEESLGTQLRVFGDRLTIDGDDDRVIMTLAIVEKLTAIIKRGVKIGPADIISATSMAENGTLEYFGDMYTETLLHDAKGQAVRVKNFGQRQYVQAIAHQDITFGIGPAGTGKTYLAVAMAVAALKQGSVEKIIISRPAVEAGESLGFLPGDLKEKVDPYLRPIYDALYAILGKERTDRLLERETIEIAPLAYMRGRTLDNAFIILDEAQNTTPPQMKMFLTRLGFGSKMVVNGDLSQVDLPRSVTSGLRQAAQILAAVPHIQMIYFKNSEVVRHPVVAKVVAAYDQASENLK